MTTLASKEQIELVTKHVGNFRAFMLTMMESAHNIGLMIKHHNIPPEKLTGDLFDMFPAEMFLHVAETGHCEMYMTRPPRMSNNEKKRQKRNRRR